MAAASPRTARKGGMAVAEWLASSSLDIESKAGTPRSPALQRLLARASESGLRKLTHQPQTANHAPVTCLEALQEQGQHISASASHRAIRKCSVPVLVQGSTGGDAAALWLGAASTVARTCRPIVSLDIGGKGTAAAADDGKVFLWGGWGDASGGPIRLPGAPSPGSHEWHPSTPITAVACGDTHALLLCKKGGVYTWGDSDCGALGHGPSVSSLATPTLLPARPARCLAASATASAVLVGSSLFTCGALSHSIPRSSTLTAAPALKGVSLTSLAAGEHHLVMLTARGTALVWGSDSVGQCGGEGPHNQPHILLLPCPPGKVRRAVTHIAAGPWHTLAGDKGGVVWGCGAFAGALSTPLRPLLSVTQLLGPGAPPISHLVAGVGSSGVVLSDGRALVSCGDTTALTLPHLDLNSPTFQDAHLGDSTWDAGGGAACNTQAVLHPSTLLGGCWSGGAGWLVTAHLSSAPRGIAAVQESPFMTAVQSVLRGAPSLRRVYAGALFPSSPPSLLAAPGLPHLLTAIGTAMVGKAAWEAAGGESRWGLLCVPPEVSGALRQDQIAALQAALEDVFTAVSSLTATSAFSPGGAHSPGACSL